MKRSDYFTCGAALGSSTLARAANHLGASGAFGSRATPVRACLMPVLSEEDRAHYEERLAEFRPPRFTRCAIAACAAR